MTWNNVSKPIVSSWMNENPTGRTQYDQSNILYDDPSIFYDGVDPLMWTPVPKPTNGRLIVPGMATGLITPPTDSRQYDASGWIKVPKPTV